MVKISVVILTKNEEINITECILALKSFDDIHVVDSGSTDKTTDIASSLGAKVHVRPFDTFSGQRNFAHECCDLKHKWVLHIDADEVVTPALIKELEEVVSTEAGFDCFEIPSRLIFLGNFLRFASDYPVYQVRLLKLNMRFKEVGHGQKEIAAADRIGRLKNDYLHYNFSHGLSHWLVRHVGYAKKEAAEILNLDRGANKKVSNSKSNFRPRHFLKTCFNHLPFIMRPFIKFIYLYIFKFGFLDGKAGLMFCVLQFIYEAMIGIFYYALRLGDR